MAFYGKAREVPRTRSSRRGFDTELVTLYHVCLLLLVHEVTSEDGSVVLPIPVNSTAPIETASLHVGQHLSQSSLSTDRSFHTVPISEYFPPGTTIVTETPIESSPSEASDAQSLSQTPNGVDIATQTTEEPPALRPLSVSTGSLSLTLQAQSTRRDDVIISSASPPDFFGNLSTPFIPSVSFFEARTNFTPVDAIFTASQSTEDAHSFSTSDLAVPHEHETVSSSTEGPRIPRLSSPVVVPFTQDKTDISKVVSTRKDNLIPQDGPPNFVFSSTSNNDVIALVSDADNELPISLDVLFASSPASRSSSTLKQTRQQPKFSDGSTMEAVTGFEDTEISSTEFRPEASAMTQAEDELPLLFTTLYPDPPTTLTTSEATTALPEVTSTTTDTTFETTTEIYDSLVEDFEPTTERSQLSERNDTLLAETQTRSSQREPETSKHYENLSSDESVNSVTVMFAAPSDTAIHWKAERNRIFRTFVTEVVNQFIADEDGGGDWVNPEYLVYVHPSPVIEERVLYVVFFIRNHSSQDSEELIPASTIVSALRGQKDQLQQQMGLNVTFITNGIIMVRWNESPFFVRHAIVFISLLAVAFFCIVVIMIALIYIRCRNSRGRWDRGEYGDKKKLKKDMKITREIGDLQSERQICDDEKVGGHGGYLNGNGSHVIALQNEGWVIPFEEVTPTQQQHKMESEDTKL